MKAKLSKVNGKLKRNEIMDNGECKSGDYHRRYSIGDCKRHKST